MSMSLTWTRALIGAVLLCIAGFAVGVSQSETIRKVETVTETATHTPYACIQALDYAGEGLEQTSDLFGIAATGDVSALEAAAADFADWTKENQPTIERVAGECRASE